MSYRLIFPIEGTPFAVDDDSGNQWLKSVFKSNPNSTDLCEYHISFWIDDNETTKLDYVEFSRKYWLKKETSDILDLGE